MIGLVTLAFAAGQAQQTLPPEQEWHYVVPAEGEFMRRPTLTALPLNDTPADELRLQIEPAGLAQLYGMLRFGDPDSTRIAIALHQTDLDRAVLYLDANRDLVISPDERVASADGRSWETSLAVATTDSGGAPSLVPRRVAFSLGVTSGILSAATLGWLEGEVLLGEEVLAVRRRDADVNGFFSDATDQLWLDRDADGTWSALSELYVVQPILSFADRRYSLHSSRLGADLKLRRLEGSGTVRVHPVGIERLASGALRSAQALLVGRDGSAILAQAPGSPTEVPIGDYRVSMVTLRLAEPNTAKPWNYIFSSSEAAGENAWRSVAKDEQLDLDPVGNLDFGIQVFSGESTAPGASISLRPALYTADRLLVNTVYRGQHAPGTYLGTQSANVRLLDQAGHTLSQANSGFA